jgi:hypothetical protein
MADVGTNVKIVLFKLTKVRFEENELKIRK